MRFLFSFFRTDGFNVALVTACHGIFHISSSNLLPLSDSYNTSQYTLLCILCYKHLPLTDA